MPVPREHAVGGNLIAVGDVVDLIAVEEGSARYVVVGAQVVAVNGNDAAAGLAATQGGFSIVVAVDAPTALAVAEALQADSVEVVRATGAPAPEFLELPESEGASDGLADDPPVTSETPLTTEGS